MPPPRNTKPRPGRRRGGSTIDPRGRSSKTTPPPIAGEADTLAGSAEPAPRDEPAILHAPADPDELDPAELDVPVNTLGNAEVEELGLIEEVSEVGAVVPAAGSEPPPVRADTFEVMADDVESEGLVDEFAEQSTVAVDLEELDEVDEAPPARALSQPAPPLPPPRAARSTTPPPLPRAVTAPPPPPAEARVREAASSPVEPTTPSPLDAELDAPSALDALIAAPESAAARAEALDVEIEAAGQAGDKESAAQLAYELGELSERQLGDESRAIKAFGRALQTDAALRANLWAIRRLFYRRALWPNLVKLIAADARFADSDAARAELHVERGQVFELRLSDDAEARAAYEQAIAVDPACQLALLGLERIAFRQGDQETLERAWSGLADAVAAPRRRLGYLLDLADLHAAQGRYGEAEAALARAAELPLGSGDDAERVLRERERLAERAGDEVELLAAIEARVALLVERLGADGDAGDAGDASRPLARAIVTACRRAARIAVSRGELERAWAYLQQALALAPADPLVVADLADLAERLGKFGELAELVEGWASKESDPARALGLGLRRADALFRAGQAEAARSLLATLAAGAPGYLPILAMRERDALARGDVAELAQVSGQMAEAAARGGGFGAGESATPDPAHAAELALVAGDQLVAAGRDGEARTSYLRALELDPGMPGAVEALVGLYERTGKLDEAATLLELHSEDGAPEARRHLLERLAGLYQQLDQPADLHAALERLRALDPDDAMIGWRLEEVLGALGKHAERLAVLVELADGLAHPDHKTATLLEAARIADEELADLPRAIELYREVVSAWPTDRYARAALIDALRRAGRLDEVAAERRAEAEVITDGAALARALREAGDLLLERLDRPAEAAAAFGDLLDRTPDDLAALRGRADAQLLTGDATAALAALEAEVDGQRDGAGQLAALHRLGWQAERLGRVAEAEDAYRRAQLAEPTVAHATVALLDLAIGRGDLAAELAALEVLVDGRSSGETAAEFAERAGWLAALGLGEHERAADLFALAAAPVERTAPRRPLTGENTDIGIAVPSADVGGGDARPGALLGAALVEAKRGDKLALGEALARLGGRVAGSYAAASLLLRAAVLAEAEGDEQASAARLRRADEVAPGDPTVQIVIGELESGFDPARPLGAGVEAALARADRIQSRIALAVDPGSRNDLHLDRAELLEAAGKLAEAGRVVARVLAEQPEDRRALGLLRRLYRRAGDAEGVARAALQLARLTADHDGKLELLREAATVFDGAPRDVGRAVAVYRRILAEDPGAPELDRLAELLAEADDTGGLAELYGLQIAHRSTAGDVAGEVAARVRRAELRESIGDKAGADADLTAALELRPDDGDALFRRAELSVELGDPRRTAALYQRFLAVSTDPARRGRAELALSQILADKMDDVAGALVQLERVVRESPEDSTLRERLVGLLIRAGEPDRAIAELDALGRLRTSDVDRARDALRRAGIARDQLGDREQARTALARAHQLDPLAVDVIRELAELSTDPAARQKLYDRALADLRAAARAEPDKVTLYDGLETVARLAGDAAAERAALEARAAFGDPVSRARAVAEPAASVEVMDFKGAIGEAAWAELYEAAARGVNAAVWSSIAAAVARSHPTEAAQLGFARGDRLKEKDLERRFPAVARLARVFGLGEIEVWVSSEKEGYTRVVSNEVPAIYLGADVANAASPGARFLLGRALAHARHDTGTLADLREDEIAPTLAAALLACGISPLPVALASVDGGKRADHERRLAKYLGRRERKALGAIDRLEHLGDPVIFRAAALGGADRAGLIVAGGLLPALDKLDAGQGGRALVDQPAALALTAWSVGAECLSLIEVLRRGKGAS